MNGRAATGALGLVLPWVLLVCACQLAHAWPACMCTYGSVKFVAHSDMGSLLAALYMIRVSVYGYTLNGISVYRQDVLNH